ncbi:aminotransferase class III-fold pyridoxal phosphate-dependent enzyme [Gynuella sp.]
MCDGFDIMLIINDIRVVCGRSGRFFSYEYAEIVPNMVCVSKFMGTIGLP